MRSADTKTLLPCSSAHGPGGICPRTWNKKKRERKEKTPQARKSPDQAKNNILTLKLIEEARKRQRTSFIIISPAAFYAPDSS